MAEPVLGRVDQPLMSAFAVEFAMRVKAISEPTLMATGTSADALAIARTGWEMHPFPDYPDAVIVRTEHGWAHLPADVAQPDHWDTADDFARRSALNMTISRMFVFASLGEFADAILNANADRLCSGVWACVRAHLSDSDYETMRFLHALGGGVIVPASLFTVLGLPHAATAV